MGVWSAMDWWDEWKLRILVLCSLSVQLFLFFADAVRTWYVLRRLRVMVWIAYLGGDAMAIYALATLFNRQKQRTMADGRGGNDALEVLWAPVLLIHLGGPPHISAYSLEDNELWKRHAITLVSQVAVALYVFCKWWSGEKRLLQAAVLLFIVGILRFSQKPWALRRASFRTMVSTNLSPRISNSRWSALRTFFLEPQFEVQERREESIIDVGCSLKQYVQKARKLVIGGGTEASDEAQQQADFKNKGRAIKYIYKMFVDLSPPYSFRIHYLKFFLRLDDENGHKILREWIQRQFSTMYTKILSVGTGLGGCLFLLLLGLALASVVLFAKSGKDGYNKSDIMVTYILFSGTVVMESSLLWKPFLCLLFFRCNLANLLEERGYYIWQDMVSQHSIMSFCARKTKPTTLMKLAVFSYLRDYINKHLYIWHEPTAQQISVLVRRHAEDGWKKYIHDGAAYRRFSNLRGEKTLRKHNLVEQLLWTFDLPFDEYVLVWHVATDICRFHQTNTSPQGPIPPSRHNSEIISNHMIYLLFIRPEMLMLGTRQELFMFACRDIQLLIKDEPAASLDQESIARQIFRMKAIADPMISNAHKLAEALIGLDDNTRWEVIQGVWVEMLCYSASRCRGYEHAKSLADGGEYLTNVWLLWSLMGMEILPDKMHMPGPPESEPDEEQAPASG